MRLRDAGIECSGVELAEVEPIDGAKEHVRVGIDAAALPAVERRRYNEVAQSYNTARRRFPAVLFAGLMGFTDKPYFESKPGADEPPVVEF